MKRMSNLVSLDRVRERKKTPFIQMLKDTRRVVDAIATRTCLVCNSKKACVTKTGVCSNCFDSELSADEKKVAMAESIHKIIKVQVLDDRWNK